MAPPSRRRAAPTHPGDESARYDQRAFCVRVAHDERVGHAIEVRSNGNIRAGSDFAATVRRSWSIDPVAVATPDGKTSGIATTFTSRSRASVGDAKRVCATNPSVSELPGLCDGERIAVNRRVERQG